jgi:hypothetical protein
VVEQANARPESDHPAAEGHLVIQPHLTGAQHRMLGRLVRGERLPARRFLPTMATVAALARKGLIGAHGSASDLFATTRGRDVYAIHGKQPATATG